MATPSASNVAFAELAPHSLYLAVMNGRTLIAARAFSLDAKTDIMAFAAEHQLTGTVRASVLGAKNYLHRSNEAESGAVRQPAALQGHAGKLPHGLGGTPTAVAVDAATGAAVDATRVSPWLLAAVDSHAITHGRDTLAGFGLTPADITLAATIHLGAIVGSIPAGETALVVIPGDEDAQLAWVTSEGVQAVSVAPIGFSDIYEAVQRGLGLKFKAAAGKLFYNESYDFGDAAPKIAEPLATTLKPILAGRPANCIHVAGLIPSQNWLLEEVSKVLGVQVWGPSGAAFTSRLQIDGDVAGLSPRAAGVVQLASAGSADRSWVQTTLEALAARQRATAVPFPATRTVPPQPVQPAPVVAVEVKQAPAPVAKSKKGPVFIAAGVSLVAIVVGLAHFRSPPRSDAVPAPAPAPAVTPQAPAPAPTPAPERVAAPTPSPAPVQVAAPQVVNTVPAVGEDARKFSNARYRFEVSEKGFIRSLATARDEVLVESAAGVSLQGSYVGTDGRRKWFNVGGVDDVGYQATVRKSVMTDGATVFDVKITHPRFEAEQTFRCLPDSVKVSVRFTPINLRDPRGVIAAVHSVRLSPVALNPSVRMRPEPNRFAYAMKSGTLNLSFDNSVWSRDGAEGRQTIVAGENGVAFHFTETSDASRNSLSYEISIP